MKCRFRLVERRAKMACLGIRKGSHKSLALLVFCGALLTFGCDTGSFIPPPPEGLRDEEGNSVSALSASDSAMSPGLEAVPQGARSIELILDRRSPDEAESVRAAARLQAGYDKVRLRPTVLSEQDLPAQQAEMVREALLRQPLALVVEPADPTDRRLADVLHKAQDEGVPIVLLNRPLSAPGAGAGHPDSKEDLASPSKAGQPGREPAKAPAAKTERPMILVTPPLFEPSARQLVASAVRNAKNARLDPKGGAILLVNTIGDPFLRDRTDALRTALKAKGITTIEELPFAESFEVGSKLLSERLKANPKIALVFSIDTLSSSAIRNAMNNLGAERPFILAGYSAEENHSDLPKVGDFAAVASFAPHDWCVKRLIQQSLSRKDGPCPAGSKYPSWYTIHPRTPHCRSPRFIKATGVLRL